MAKATISDEWGEFTGIPNAFIQNSADLSDHARWLFVLLRFYTNSETKTAFPSYDLIHQKTGWANATIAKAVRELEQAGWVERKKQFSGNTHYTLKRPVLHSVQDCTDGSNGQSFIPCRTAPDEGQSFTSCSPVLHDVKPIKIEITKTKNTKSKNTAQSSTSQRGDSPKSEKPDSKPRHEFYDLFAAAYLRTYGIPYQASAADFPQFERTRKKYAAANWELTPDKWSIGVENYLASVQTTHTMAYLAINFGTFWRSKLDRFAKPLSPITAEKQERKFVC